MYIPDRPMYPGMEARHFQRSLEELIPTIMPCGSIQIIRFIFWTETTEASIFHLMVVKLGEVSVPKPGLKFIRLDMI